MAAPGAPAGWVARESRSYPGRFYYFNPLTGESTWEVNAAPPAPAPAPAASHSAATEVRVAHILAKHTRSRRPSSWRQANITRTKEEATARILDLKSQIESKAQGNPDALRQEFMAVARTESDCSSAEKGGDLGFFGRGKMQPPFEAAAFGLRVGQLAGPIETDSGVHIMLRLG